MRFRTAAIAARLFCFASVLPGWALADCAAWNPIGEWTVKQANNANTTFQFAMTLATKDGRNITGTARYWDNGFKNASLDGRLNGGVIDFTIYWPWGSTGVYSGNVLSSGRVEGISYDRVSPGAKASWYLEQRFRCAGDAFAAVQDAVKNATGSASTKTKRAPSRTAGEVTVIGGITPPPSRAKAGAEDVGGIAGAVPGNADIATQWMTGTFNTDFGVLVLDPRGGEYAYNGGRVLVTRINGNVMTGTWQQSEASQQCKDGTFRGSFRFEFDATGFAGAYGYCDEPATVGKWNGKRQ